jgi:hypothetical protein
MKIKNFLLLLLAVLLIACDEAFSLSNGSENVGNLVATIADFDLLAGYAPEFSTTVMGYQTTAYARGNGPGHIYLIQFNDPADADKLEQALDQIVIGSGDPYTHLTVIETSLVVVRGREITLVISEAISSEGLACRQAVVGFQGNGGPALLVFSESLENWDEATLTNLIASIQ